MKHTLARKAEQVGDTIQGNWNEIKGKLKQKYAELTDDDLVYAEGKEDELYGKLQKRLGISREEAENAISSFTRKG
ncbi:MAG: CsbD family protein [Flavobacteriales bacterium]|nr:CsbD family protein [Flavobacteriales bacterium]